MGVGAGGDGHHDASSVECIAAPAYLGRQAIAISPNIVPIMTNTSPSDDSTTDGVRKFSPVAEGFSSSKSHPRTNFRSISTHGNLPNASPPPAPHISRYPVGIFGPVSTPPEVSLMHRNSFPRTVVVHDDNAVATFQHQEQNHKNKESVTQPSAPGSPGSTAASGVQPPPTDAFRSSYLTTSTVSWISNLSDFPLPPKSRNLTSLLIHLQNDAPDLYPHILAGNVTHHNSLQVPRPMDKLKKSSNISSPV